MLKHRREAQNVSLGTGHLYNGNELLSWINRTLQIQITRVDEICEGAAFCQLMALLFPGCVRLADVRFQSNRTEDHVHNFQVLQSAFDEVGVARNIPVEKIVHRHFVVTITFLEWFRLFFEKNHRDVMEEQTFPHNSSGEASESRALMEATDPSSAVMVLSDDDLVAQQDPQTVEGDDGVVDVRSYLDDLIVEQTPFCLYLLTGLQVDGGRRTSLLLIGYYEQQTDEGVVRLLDRLQMSADAENSSCEASDATLLVDRMQHFKLPLSKLVAFYSNASKPQVFVSRLMTFNPTLIPLCGLEGLTERACRSWISGPFGCVADLVRAVHGFYTSTSQNSLLQDVFSGASQLLSLQTVSRMEGRWTELLGLFSSLQRSKATDQIKGQLMDARVKLKFMFLSRALRPVLEMQQSHRSDLGPQLQFLSLLLTSHASAVFRPSAVRCLLKTRDLSLFHDRQQVLPAAQVGALASDPSWLTTFDHLEEKDKTDFQKDVATFYRSSLKMLLENIPRQLDDEMMWTISKVLTLVENVNEVKASAVSGLGVGLGLCGQDSSAERELTSDYLAFITHARKRQSGGHALSWAQMLNLVNPSSPLRRLLLTLLALPASLDLPGLLSQVFRGARTPRMEGSAVSHTQLNVLMSVEGSDDEDENMEASPARLDPEDTEQVHSGCGELVWGELEGFPSWPAISAPFHQDQDGHMVTVEWLGQNMSSSVNKDSLKPYFTFNQNFCPKSYVTIQTYQEGILSSLLEAARRCRKRLKVKSKDLLTQELLDWAFTGFRPTGPAGLKPSEVMNDAFKKQNKSNVKKKAMESMNTTSQKDGVKRSIRRKPATDAGDKRGAEMVNVRRSLKKLDLLEGGDDDASSVFVPNRRKSSSKNPNKSSSYQEPNQQLRETIVQRILDQDLDIEGFCLCCGSEEADMFHPLFKGSLCLECKDNFTQTLYRYDEDGYQSYCTVCCYGMEIVLCGNDNCCRSFCANCLNILVGPGTFDLLKTVDPWICYMCQPLQGHRALVPREDWSVRVQDFFANNSAMEFEPHRVYPSIAANLRRPIRVLSIFDGIGTGFLVLKELGFKVEKYVASEVCEFSLAVTDVHHDGKILQVGDARLITKEQLQQWGPFDLLIGGSPCNDLSIVNPYRKGLYEGTGRLFFEYHRILNLLKPREEDPRPFFWLFENVVFMNTHDKTSICRFLECNPVMVDAVKVSPAHRARYFWGNIPGMSRPIIASQNDKLHLQDCLEGSREARLDKVRTITTNSNSLKQGRNANQLPVLHKGREDVLWITELEKIFGFPKHYTDVKNMRCGERQKVLGKAWSVPVIRHLFAPLKDYFACEELNVS